MLLENKDALIYVYEGEGAIGGAEARAFVREGASVFPAGSTRAKLKRSMRKRGLWLNSPKATCRYRSVMT